MNRLLAFVLFLFLCYTGLIAQINPYGMPEIINYPPTITNGSEQNWSIVQDKRGVMYFGNDFEGVLEYDGNEWNTIPIPNNSSVRSLDCSEEGTVYVGAVSEIGYLSPDESGLLEYKSLIPKLDSARRKFTDVWKTFCVDDKVFFYSEKFIFIYHPKTDELNSCPVEMHMLLGFYENGRLYAGNFEKGLMVLEGDSIFIEANGGEYYKKKDVFGIASFDEQHLLIGVSAFGLSLYNTETGKVDPGFAPQATNDYLNESFLAHLSRLSDGNFAASTLGGGVAFINRKGEIYEIASSKEGLQSQTVFRSYQSTDINRNQHLWSAMGLGISKINIESPIRHFTEQTGYEGLINTINSIDDRIFIGTTSGLFASTIRDNYSSFEKIENITRPIWDLDKHTLASGEKILMAIGDDGLFQIHKNGEWVNLKNQIRGVADVAQRVFWGYAIFRDPIKKNRIIIGMASSLTSLVYENGVWNQEFAIDSLYGEVRSIAVSKDNKLWFGTKLGGVGCIPTFTDDNSEIFYSMENGLPAKEDNIVYQYGNDILIGTVNGIYRIYDQEDTVYFYRDSLLNSYFPEGMNAVNTIYQDPDSTLWFSFESENDVNQIIGLTPSDKKTFEIISKPFHSLPDFPTDAFYSIIGDDIWFSKSNLLYHYSKGAEINEGTFSAMVRRVTFASDSVIFNGAYYEKNENGRARIISRQNPDYIPSIKYADNNIKFAWSAPFFEHEENLEFSYFLEGFSKDWSEWAQEFYHDFTNLPLGEYTFRIKARNAYGSESEEDSYSFIIQKPWYFTVVAIILYLIAAVFFVYIIIALYTRRLKNENIRLEGIIQDRTAEIRKQKEELTDSIEYASRIQRALLPPDQMLAKHQLDHFIFFKPRDIVSGDFYWFGSSAEKIFIVAADCTGHGVPGAFMSMLGISFLDEIVIKSGVSDTNLILDALRNHVITSLRQTGKSMEESTKDGMDLAMIAIDKKTRTVQFSGAYNPLYAVRELKPEEKKLLKNGEELDLSRGAIYNDTHILYQIKADLMPIGISEKAQNFTSTLIDDPEATYYLFSDGYVDQFGGPSGKKFMSRNFKKLLLDIQGLPMDKQGEKLENTLIKWMEDVSQIDDILVIGVRLTNS